MFSFTQFLKFFDTSFGALVLGFVCAVSVVFLVYRILLGKWGGF